MEAREMMERKLHEEVVMKKSMIRALGGLIPLTMVLALLWAGCLPFEPMECQEDGDCGEGFSCVEGTCRSPHVPITCADVQSEQECLEREDCEGLYVQPRCGPRERCEGAEPIYIGCQPARPRRCEDLGPDECRDHPGCQLEEICLPCACACPACEGDDCAPCWCDEDCDVPCELFCVPRPEPRSCEDARDREVCEQIDGCAWFEDEAPCRCADGFDCECVGGGGICVEIGPRPCEDLDAEECEEREDCELLEIGLAPCEAPGCDEAWVCVPRDVPRRCEDLDPDECQADGRCELIFGGCACEPGWDCVCEPEVMCVERQPARCEDLDPDECLMHRGCGLQEICLPCDCGGFDGDGDRPADPACRCEPCELVCVTMDSPMGCARLGRVNCIDDDRCEWVEPVCDCGPEFDCECEPMKGFCMDRQPVGCEGLGEQESCEMVNGCMWVEEAAPCRCADDMDDCDCPVWGRCVDVGPERCEDLAADECLGRAGCELQEICPPCACFCEEGGDCECGMCACELVCVSAEPDRRCEQLDLNECEERPDCQVQEEELCWFDGEDDYCEVVLTCTDSEPVDCFDLDEAECDGAPHCAWLHAVCPCDCDDEADCFCECEPEGMCTQPGGRAPTP